MKAHNSAIEKLIAGTMLPMFVLCGLAASAQEKANQKIPLEIIEEKAPGPPAEHAMALGVNVDLFPTIVSAASPDFGLGIQPWFGIDHVRMRLDIAHVRIPDTIAGTKYFYKNNCNAFSLVGQYLFGNNFDGFVLGAGLGVWQNSISHKFLHGTGNSYAPFLTVEGGYIWKFHKNVYLEPCIALDVMLVRQTIRLFEFTYKPLPVTGEITVKFGLYVDL